MGELNLGRIRILGLVLGLTFIIGPPVLRGLMLRFTFLGGVGVTLIRLATWSAKIRMSNRPVIDLLLSSRNLSRSVGCH